MTKKELLKNLKENIYCRIGPSKIHGVGVIAVRDIPKNINPFIGSGKCNYIQFKKDELVDLNPEIKKMVSDFFVSEKDSIFIPSLGLNGIDISFYMNHSQEPNVTTDDGETFVTIQKIHIGEELTCNYTVHFGKDSVFF